MCICQFMCMYMCICVCAFFLSCPLNSNLDRADFAATIRQFSRHQLSILFNSVQPNSDTIYLRIVSDSTGSGFNSTKLSSNS